MFADIRYMLWSLRYEVKHFFRETLPWKIAYLLPRKIALLAFVRVSATQDAPTEFYSNAYKAFEAGAKR